jgi:hypothetical protein
MSREVQWGSSYKKETQKLEIAFYFVKLQSMNKRFIDGDTVYRERERKKLE